MLVHLKKASLVSFTDHRGDVYTVGVVETGEEVSRSPDWEAATNTFHFNVILVGEV